jgi:hypothetical protein
MDWNRNQENIVIKQIAITGTNHLNITAENYGSIQSQLIWLGIFNTTVTPNTQKYQALTNVGVPPSNYANIISSFTVLAGKQYVVQLVTELGNVVESMFYPANSVSCAMTLLVTPATAYQSNNFTVLLTVTPNNTIADSIQTLSATLGASPANLVHLMSSSSLSVSRLARGTSAYFWWIYNATAVGAVVFNGTYNLAPSGVYALASVNILARGTGATGPQGPAGFSTKATFDDLIQNYPYGGAPTTMTPNALSKMGCLIYPFEIDRNITVTAIYIMSNAVKSSCLRVGIYNGTGTLLYASGALSTVLTGWINDTVTTPFALASGTYYFGTTSNGYTDNNIAAYTVTPPFVTATLPRWGSVPSSNGLMPTSISPSSITPTIGGWMCYVLLSSVTH